MTLSAIPRWIEGRFISWKELLAGPNLANMPPPLPYRCGTMLMECSPEVAARLRRGWQEDEDRFVAWVAAHPAPRQEWLLDVERLSRRRLRSQPVAP